MGRLDDGPGLYLVLVALGAAREISAAGTLFANASLLLGESFRFLEVTVIPNYKGFLLMALPPGGFIMLAFLIVGKRLIDQQFAKKKVVATVSTPAIAEQAKELS
jgi:electron transport complex protein RnfE